MRNCIFLIVFVALTTVPAWSQDSTPKPAEDSATEQNSSENQEPEVAVQAPYDDKLLRLAEVLGSIHHLRNLCGANEGTTWRDQMTALLAAEQPKPERRARLVARFNRGFRAFEQNYTTCTPSALVAVERYMKEGVLLSSQITSRFGR